MSAMTPVHFEKARVCNVSTPRRDQERREAHRGYKEGAAGSSGHRFAHDRIHFGTVGARRGKRDGRHRDARHSRYGTPERCSRELCSPANLGLRASEHAPELSR